MLWGNFKESDSCDGCPLLLAELCSATFDSYGGEPVEPPCTYFEDDVDMNKWVKDKMKQILEYEEREDRKIRAKKEEALKNKIKQERRRESKYYVINETRELVRLNTLLKKVESQINYLSRMKSMPYNNVFILSDNFKNIEDYITKREKLLEDIKRVETLKKLKLIELRKNRKDN